VVGCLGAETLDFARKSESVIIFTTRRSETWRELAIIEIVARIEFLACLDQLRNFVSYAFDLAKLSFSIFLRVSYEDNQEIVLGPQSIMGINKIAKNVLGVEASRRTRKQRHVESFPVRTIDNQGRLAGTNEDLPAVSTLIGVSLQGVPPSRPAPVVAGSLTEVLVNSEERTDNLSVRTDGTVRKSPFPGALQVPEKARAPRAVFRVQQTHDFGTVS
jgi:hypothetical protein